MNFNVITGPYLPQACTDAVQVEGPLNRGVVQVHMVKPLDKYEWEYLLLSLDVNGQSSYLVLRGALY